MKAIDITADTNLINLPVQMFSVCSTIGELTPVRFRFENEQHGIETVPISRVLTHKDTMFNGIPEIIYTCEANISGNKRIFTLVYSIRSHKWRLMQIVV